MFNPIKWIAFKNKNGKFLSATESLQEGLSMEQVLGILGPPSRITDSDFGRVVWIFDRGIYYGVGNSESAHNGSSFCLWVEFHNEKYLSHRLTFLSENTEEKRGKPRPPR